MKQKQDFVKDVRNEMAGNARSDNRNNVYVIAEEH